MNQDDGLRIFITSLSIIIAVNLFSPNIWIGRTFVALTLAFSAFYLPEKLYLWPSVFAISADLMYLSTGPSFGDISIWLGFFLISYTSHSYLRLYSKENNRDNTKFRSKSSDQQKKRTISRENFEPPPINSVKDAESPQNIIRNLLMENMKWAQHQFQFDNLIYFQVDDENARPLYLINEKGEIRRDSVIGSEVNQGVGWILRNEKKLILSGNQIDWRSLQYHANPVSIEYIWMKPVQLNGELIGVLVVEWDSEPDLDTNQMEDFHEKVRKMLSLRSSINSLKIQSKKLNLVERIHQVDPLTPDNSGQVISRFKEIINEFLPSQHIEFLKEKPDKNGDNVLNKRDLFHKNCYEFIESNQRILRYDGSDDTALPGRKLKRFLPPDVQSFLGGPIVNDGEILGVFILDHPDSGYFSSEDKNLLEKLLKHLTPLVVLRNLYDSSQNDKEYFKELFGNITETFGSTDFDELSRSIVESISKTISNSGVGLYWSREDQFRRLQHDGDGNISAYLDKNSPLVGRLENSIESQIINLPNIHRFSEFEAPTDVNSLRIIPIGKNDLHGFLIFLENHAHSLDNIEDFIIQKSAPIFEFALRLSHSKKQMSSNSKFNDQTEHLKYKPWKKKLRDEITGNQSDSIILWEVRIPGYSDILEGLGPEKASQWVRRISELLERHNLTNNVTVLEGSLFLGFEINPRESFQNHLEQLTKKIGDWSFPTGEWPEQIDVQIQKIDSSAGEIENMIREFVFCSSPDSTQKHLKAE